MTVRVNKLLPPAVTAEPLPSLAVMLSEEAKMPHLFSASTVVLQFGVKRRQLQSFVSF